MTRHEYKIAVLIPTHKRTDGLSKSVFSLLDRAQDLSTVQFLFGIDNNDDTAINHFNKVIQPRLNKAKANYKAIGFEPMGYAGLNRYFDGLTDYADADWYFCWSDDAIMDSDHWDQHIRECSGEFRLLKVHAHNEHPYSIFPIIPAEWRGITGYLSRHQLIDAEVSQLAYMLDIIKIIDVWVTHDRPELTGQDMDETAQQKQYFEGNPNDPRDFYSPLFTSGRQEDLLKLVTWMKQRNLDLTFYNTVQAGTQDPWQRMKENDPNHQTTQYVFEKDQQGLVHMVPTK
jgi:hypothetical protein